MGKMTDTERLDWLQDQSGCALLTDNIGDWTVSCDSFQQNDGPTDATMTFFIYKGNWSNTIRGAIDAAIFGENGGQDRESDREDE